MDRLCRVRKQEAEHSNAMCPDRTLTSLPGTRNDDAYSRATLHSVALGCNPLRRPAFGSAGRRSTLHHAGRGNLAICATGHRRAPGGWSRAWTRPYAALLCRARNLTARSRPQRRQRQRPSTSSTRKLSDVSRCPLPQASGMVGHSRMRSPEKHTTSVLVAAKHAPATNVAKR